MKKMLRRSCYILTLFAVIILAACHYVPQKDLLITSEDALTVHTLQSQLLNDLGEEMSNGLDPLSIKVVTWNGLEGNRTSLFKNWFGDREEWREDFFEIAENSDLIILQEAFVDEETIDILAQLKNLKGPIWWTLSPNFIYRMKNAPTGVLTISSSVPSDTESFRTKEPVLTTPKASLLTKYYLNGSDKKLMVVNVHAILLGEKTFKSQLCELEERIILHDGPVILAGDFNAFTEDRVEELERMVEFLELRSAFDNVTPEDDRSRFLFRYPYDHFFYKGLKLKCQPSVKKVESSDHNPILVHFELEEGALEASP
jgi:endonuclease/exonuclease/phosphatase (EEP) superfamily protein YafD